MPFIYSVGRRQIQLSLSSDHVAVRFDGPGMAMRAVGALHASEEGLGLEPRRFGDLMLLSATRALDQPEATVRNALSARHARRVRRTVPVYVEEDSGLRVIPTDEITIRFKAGTPSGPRESLLRSLHLTVRRTSEFSERQYVVEPAGDLDASDTLDLANKLAEQEDVVDYAVPNFLSEYRKAFVPNDPLFLRQWHLDNRGGDSALSGEDVDAVLAWDITAGGRPDVVIAIVDDGVDIDHPDLRRNIWRNPDRGAPDRRGRNFYDDNFDPRPRYFLPPYDQLRGNDSHGTPCAGVAAAVGNNRRGVTGIAYRCKILPVKIFGADDLAPSDRVADAIRYAGRHAQVISCSWSGPANPDLESAVNDVVQGGRGGRGCPVFCATGNGDLVTGLGLTRIEFPARLPNTLAVGASNDQGRRSVYSNYGPGLDFLAPSSDRGRQGITSTDISLLNRGFDLQRAYTDSFGGTSSATPLAAGIAALVLSVNPTLAWDQIRSILRETAEKIDPHGAGYRDGYSLQYGYGRLNASRAVRRAQELANG